MPQAGYKAVTIRDETYNIAKREAEDEAVSIGDVISRALNRYVNKKVEDTERVKRILKVMEETENKEGGS
jgi:predicted CopG family antitoxin